MSVMNSAFDLLVKQDVTLAIEQLKKRILKRILNLSYPSLKDT